MKLKKLKTSVESTNFSWEFALPSSNPQLKLVLSTLAPKDFREIQLWQETVPPWFHLALLVLLIPANIVGGQLRLMQKAKADPRSPRAV